MLISLVLAWFRRRPAFTWSPALDLSDNVVYSTLIPHAHPCRGERPAAGLPVRCHPET